MGSPDLELREDGSVVVEAPSVESALEAVQRHCGPDAMIVDAEKVQTKGIAGFFSKQLYRVHVAPAAVAAEARAPQPATTAATGAAPSPDRTATETADEQAVFDASQAVDVVLRRIEAGEHHPHTSFGEALHAELAARGQAPSRAEPAPPREPARDATTAGPTTPPPAPNPHAAHGDVADAPSADPAWSAAGARHDTGTEPAMHAIDPTLGTDERVRTYEDLIRQRAALLGSPGATIDLRDRHAPGGGADHARATGGEAGSGVTPSAPTGPARATGRHPLGRPVDEWVPGAGPVRWSLDQLSRLGLPYRLISALGDLDPADDLAWVYRLAESAAPLCGCMPDEAMVLVGRESECIAGPMGIETTAYPHPPSYDGDAAVAVDGFADAVPFLQRIRAGRPLHVLVDGSGFGIELLDPGRCDVPVAVVSMTRDALALGLQAAVATDGVLGYFVADDHLVRITPFELALAVRGRMPRE